MQYVWMESSFCPDFVSRQSVNEGFINYSRGRSNGSGTITATRKPEEASRCGWMLSSRHKINELLMEQKMRQDKIRQDKDKTMPHAPSSSQK